MEKLPYLTSVQQTVIDGKVSEGRWKKKSERKNKYSTVV